MTEQQLPSFSNRWPLPGGLLWSLAAIALIELLSRSGLQAVNPGAFCFAAIAYATYAGGMRQGLIAAVTTILYLAVILSEPGHLFHYGKVECIRLCIASAISITILLIVGQLKRRAQMLHDAVVQAKSDLERQVRERTTQLHAANAQLKYEIEQGQLRERSLQKSESAYRSIFEQTAVGVVHLDLTGQIILANSKYCDLVGYSLEELQHLNFQAFTHPEDLAAAEERMVKLLSGEIASVTSDKRYICKDGTVAWANINVSLMRDLTTGEPMHFVSLLRDISGRKRAERALLASEEKYRVTVEQCPVGIVQVGLDGKCLHANSRMLEITGYSLEELRDMTFSRFTYHADLGAQLEQIKKLLSGEIKSFAMDKRYVCKDGTLLWGSLTASLVQDFSGGSPYLLCIVEDISERRMHEERLIYLAQHDYLTGLPNRYLLKERLVDTMQRADRNSTHVALLLLDLDKFKDINDSAGHETGDAVLKLAAERIGNCLGNGDMLARQGGDEFKILLDVGETDRATAVAQQIIKAFSAPFHVDGEDYFLTVSIGIVLYPTDADTIASLFRAAGIAMYAAKDRGRNNYQLFAPEMSARAVERLNMKHQLRFALERNEFFLHYQPQVDIASGRIVGTEALLRWQHPEFGLVSPARFIPLAEETGLIVPIGEWVLQTACRQNKAWQDAGFRPVKIAVNLSARQLREPRLADRVLQIVRSAGLEPRYLELEITEGLLIENIRHSRAVLAELRTAGIQVALDDFGTGYSSLTYLKNLDFDVIKMDSSFIRHLAMNTPDARNARAIAKGIISMAHSLELTVMAEGVETEAQLDLLSTMGCDYIQGFFFSRPVPADDIPRLLKATMV